MASVDQDVQQIKTEIKRKMQSKICLERNDVDTRFITLGLLREIWPSDNSRLMTFLPDRQNSHEVRNKFIRVLSTIVFVLPPERALVQRAIALFRHREYA